jgi:putative DNA primase/helicase
MEITVNKIEDALKAIPASVDRNTWFRIGAAIKSHLGEAGFTVFDEWSKTCQNKYNYKHIEATWRSISDGKITIKTLFYYAKEHGYLINYKPGEQDSFGPTSEQAKQYAQLAQEGEIEAHEEILYGIRTIFEVSEPPTAGHYYLKDKSIKSYPFLRAVTINSIKDVLVVPFTADGKEIVNCQFIYPYNEKEKRYPKYFQKYLSSDGLFVMPIEGATDTIFLTEGFATAATVSDLTGATTIACGSCHNLTKAAIKIKNLYPNSNFIIAADTGSTALDCAKKAAEAIGAHVTYPKFSNGKVGKDYSDWNDLVRDMGAEETKKQLINNIVKETTMVGWEQPKSLDTEIKEIDIIPILNAMPDWLRGTVLEVHQMVECPLSIILCSVLSVLSLSTQGLINVRLRKCLDVPISLYFLVVAASGERKTTCDSIVFKGIRDWEAKKRQELMKAYLKYEELKKSLDARISFLRSNQAKTKDQSKRKEDQTEIVELRTEKENLSPVRLPYLMHSDTTIEKLILNLFYYPSTGIVCSDGGAVFGGHSMKESEMNILAKLCSLWSGEGFNVDRKTGEVTSIAVKSKRLSVWIGIQPEVFKSFYDNSMQLIKHGGFLSRCCVTFPASTKGQRLNLTDMTTTPYLDAFNDRINEILNIPINCDKQGELNFQILTFDQNGQAVWNEFYKNVEVNMKEGECWSEMSDFASKSADNAGRLAAQLHVYEYGLEGAINQEKANQAVILAGFFLSAAKRFSELCLVADPALVAAEKLKKWLINYSNKNQTRTLW